MFKTLLLAYVRFVDAQTFEMRSLLFGNDVRGRKVSKRSMSLWECNTLIQRHAKLNVMSIASES